jgi:hypothetical protein
MEAGYRERETPLAWLNHFPALQMKIPAGRSVKSTGYVACRLVFAFFSPKIIQVMAKLGKEVLLPQKIITKCLTGYK